MATLEQVEKLRERADVSYDEAKAALDASNGDLLDALILLEKQGKVNAPAGNGFYSSSGGGAEGAGDTGRGESGTGGAPKGNAAHTGETFSDVMKRFGRFCVRMIQKGNVNSLVVLKGNESRASVPITIFVLLLLFAFWVTLPLMILGLFFGLHYRFEGPDIGTTGVNDAMDSVAKAAEDLKSSIKKD